MRPKKKATTTRRTGKIGIEVGQLAIVAAATTALFALRGWRGYPKFVIGAGSAVAIAIGVVWLIERIGNVSILPV